MSESDPVDEPARPSDGPSGARSLGIALGSLAIFGVGVLWLAGKAVDSYSVCGGPDVGALEKIRDNDDAQEHVGWTRGQVEATYGAPGDRFSYAWDASYWLRYQGFCIDSYYLVLDYDHRDIVIRAAYTGD